MSLLDERGNIMKFIMDKEKTENKVWTELISLQTEEILSSYSELDSVTKNGLTVIAKKKFFNIPESGFLKVLNKPVELFLSQYEIPFYGVIKEIKRKKKDTFEIKISFMENTPAYYRECLTDLFNYSLPA